MGIESTIEKDAKNIENTVTTEVKAVEKKVEGYVTTFEQDEKAFKEASRGAFKRFLAKIFGF